MWPFSSKEYTAYPEACEFIEDVEIDDDWEGEPTYSMTLKFREPIRDGNEISHFNLIYMGQAGLSDNLASGETKYRLGFEPEEGLWKVVFANEDNEVLITDEIRIESKSSR